MWSIRRPPLIADNLLLELFNQKNMIMIGAAAVLDPPHEESAGE